MAKTSHLQSLESPALTSTPAPAQMDTQLRVFLRCLDVHLWKLGITLPHLIENGPEASIKSTMSFGLTFKGFAAYLDTEKSEKLQQVLNSSNKNSSLRVLSNIPYVFIRKHCNWMEHIMWKWSSSVMECCSLSRRPKGCIQKAGLDLFTLEVLLGWAQSCHYVTSSSSSEQ